MRDDQIDTMNIENSLSIINDQYLQATENSNCSKTILKSTSENLNSNTDSKEWYFYSKQEKVSYIIASFMKFLLFLFLLYIFLFSLNLMTIGFNLITKDTLKYSDFIRFLLSNPFASLSIGIILTAIMQNATATTSIAVSMIGTGIIPEVKHAIPIIMGSNIGTCFTNSLIALSLANDPAEFKRAFSAATLNDIFNFLTTGVLLPLEIATDFLLKMSDELTKLIPLENADKIAQANFIAKLLDPVTNQFIRLNATAVNELSNGNVNISEISLKMCNHAECDYLSRPLLNWLGETKTGILLIVVSVLVLIFSLFGIVKALSMLIVGPIAKSIRVALNASLPGKLKWFTQVILFKISFLFTLVVQSSNIITATLVPLCGIGIVSLQRVYVMTLGSNIGTTVTGIISAFTLPSSALQKGLQLAFVYTLFNSIGVLLWLPIPYLRFPKSCARKLGEIVFKYPWFLYVYIFSVYFILPAIVLALALIPNWIGLALIGIPLILLCSIVICINKFYDSKCLPNWLRSLKPYDEKIRSISGRLFKNKRKLSSHSEDNSKVYPRHRRYFSVIDSLVKEAMLYKTFNTIQNRSTDEESGHDDDCDSHQRKHLDKIYSCDF